MTQVMAVELGPHGIRVNGVNPTVTLTPMAVKAWSDPAKAGGDAPRIPLGRFVQPEEVGDVILYPARRTLGDGERRDAARGRRVSRHVARRASGRGRQRLLDRLQRGVGLAAVGAAGLRHVRPPAAALAAERFGRRPDEIDGADPPVRSSVTPTTSPALPSS